MSVRPGEAAIGTPVNGAPFVLGEGTRLVSPFTNMVTFELQPPLSSSLTATLADGVTVNVEDVIVGHTLEPAGVLAVHKRAGSDYYEALVRP